MATTKSGSKQRKDIIRHCKEHAENLRISKDFLAQQTVYPIKLGSATEDWFKPFVDHFIVIEGMVTNNQTLQKMSRFAYKPRTEHLVSLATVRLIGAEYEVAETFPDKEYPQLSEELRIVTENEFMDGDLVQLQLLPLINECGFQVSHVSTTMRAGNLQMHLKRRLVALLTTIDWTYENLHQLIQDFDYVSREVFNKQLFWLSYRKKMLTYASPLERLEGLKEVTDYSEQLMRTLSKKGVERCIEKMLKESKRRPLPILSSIGQELLAELEANEELRIRTLEVGPYLKKDNPPMWNYF